MISRVAAAIGAIRLLGTAGVKPAHAQASVTCESMDNRYKSCRVSTNGSVRLERQVSQTSCVYGRTWGFDYNAVWVDRGCRGVFTVGGSGSGWNSGNSGQRLTCSSDDRQYQFCRVQTRGDVRLVRQLSQDACVAGRTWGFQSDGIWVVNGCRGEFEVGYYDVNWSNGNRTVTCESDDNKYRRCRVWTYGTVGVQKQLSKTTCRRNINWGYDQEGIWVNDGCRAVFTVGAGGGGWGTWPGGGNTGGSGLVNQARSACTNESTRRGYQNVSVTSANQSSGSVNVSLRGYRSNRQYNIGCTYEPRSGGRVRIVSEDMVGGGGTGNVVDLGRRGCENKAREMGYQSVTVRSATQSGNDIDVDMNARQGNQNWYLRCRYRADRNQATIYDQSQGSGRGGGGNLIQTAQSSCTAQARSQGYQVASMGQTRQMSEMVKVSFVLRRGNSYYPSGECNYIIRDRVSTVAPGNPGPQPR